MYPNPFQISLETVIGASHLFGHRLEDRASIRDSQDPALLAQVQKQSTVKLRGQQQKEFFCVAPLDILVTSDGKKKQFHIIEMNGTGIGGLTNISEHAVSCVLEGLMQMGQNLLEEVEDPPLVLVASSGLESEHVPRKNKLIYEKVLYAEALKRGFESRGERAVVSTVTQMRDAPWEMNNDRPTILLGYMKEFLRFLRPDNGTLSLFGRPVAGGVNDRFCLNLVHEFPDALDLRTFYAMNRTFVPGADKAVCYALLNEYLEHAHSPLTRPVPYQLAHTSEELVRTVLEWVRDGRKTVIKPQGTGLGHGIEFFLSAEESEERIVARIQGSLQLTEQYYGLHGGALPYTVCEFLDTATISHEKHPMFGHKYELRIVVYREGGTLKAFPSIIKVASQMYHPDHPAYLSLINNITASATATQTAGVEDMMPLCRQETLDLLDMTPEDLCNVSALSTGFVRFVLDQVEDAPEKLGLPDMTSSR